MRRLSSLCRKLRRVGLFVNVSYFGRSNYCVHVGRSWLSASSRNFSTVRECEQYLLTLFR